MTTQTLWRSPTDFVSGDKSLDISYPSVAHPAVDVTLKTAPPGDFKWVYLGLNVPPNHDIVAVHVCYQLSNSQSFISQVRILEMQTPNQAVIRHDDGTDLLSLVPVCYKSPVAAFKPAASLMLGLRLNFANVGQKITLGAIGIEVAGETAGTQVAWVDTVLGAPPPVRIGDLATKDSAALAGALLVTAKGCINAGDGGGGTFYWEPGISSGDDGGTIIVPTAATGRWRRIYSGALNVKWFGATSLAADSQAPDPGDSALLGNARAIQNAIESIRFTGGTVFFPAGKYWVAGPIRAAQPSMKGTTDYNNITLEGVGRLSQIKASTPIADETAHFGILAFSGYGHYNLKNVGIRKLRISGCDETSFNEKGFVGQLVAFNGTSGSFVIDCYVDTNPHEGLYWNDPKTDRDVLIMGNYATRIGGWGNANPTWGGSAYNTNAKNVTMIGNRSFQCHGAVEQTGSGIFANNTFEYCGVGAVDDNSSPGPKTLEYPVVQGSWRPCMSMASTQRWGKLIVQGNVIRFAGSGVGVSFGKGETIIADNIIQGCPGGLAIGVVDPPGPPVPPAEQDLEDDLVDAHTYPSTPIVIRGNYIYDTAYDTAGSPPSQNAAIWYGGGASPHTPPAIIENNTIVTGPTAPWAYGIQVNDQAAEAIVRNNTVVGAAVTGIVFYSQQAANQNVQFIDNVVIPGSMIPAITRYMWRGGEYKKTTYNGIDNGTVLSTKRPAHVRHSTPPTAGTWSVGDTVTNSSPVEVPPPPPPPPGQAKYVIEGWICVAGGIPVPGSWVERRVLTGHVT